MSKLFIHIGMHKTGTSYLQACVFPYWPGLHYHPNSHLPSLLAALPHQKVLLSNEQLMGYPFDLDRASLPKFESLLAELARHFPEADIMMSFRQHGSYLQSLYKEYLHEGGYLTFDQAYRHSNTEGWIKQDQLEYRARIRRVEAAFGREPFVFLQEELRHQPQALFREMNAFFGLPEDTQPLVKAQKGVNAGVEHYQARYLRWAHGLTRNPLNPKGKLPYYFMYHPVFQAIGLTPRQVAQKRLAFLKKKLTFPEALFQQIEREYAEDWNGVMEFIKTRREVLL